MVVSPQSTKCYNANELPPGTLGPYASLEVSCSGTFPSLIFFTGTSCSVAGTQGVLTTETGCNIIDADSNITVPSDFCANPCVPVSSSSTSQSTSGSVRTSTSVPPSSTIAPSSGTTSSTTTVTSSTTTASRTTTSQTTTSTVPRSTTTTSSSTVPSTSSASTEPVENSSSSEAGTSILPILIGILLGVVSIVCCLMLCFYERKHRHSDLSFTTGMYSSSGQSLQKPLVVYGNLSNRALLVRIISDVLKSKPE